MLLADVIQRDTRANQPAAATVATGTLYYVTDEGKLERNSGSAWQAVAGVESNQRKTRTLTCVIDGGGSVITTGVKAFVSCPYTGTITGARLLSTDPAVTTSSIVIDVWKLGYASYPPTVADTITASAKPTLSSAVKSDDTTLTGWTTSVTAGDVFGFNVDSVTAAKQVTLQLTIVLT